MRASPDSARRSAALHHAPATPAVLHALRERPIPPAPVGAAQRLLMKAGRLSYEAAWLRPLQAARREALGDAADGPPRFLVRVDEYPPHGSDDRHHAFEASERFHALMAEERVPYLMALVSQWTHDPLNPHGSGDRPLDERDRELLHRMRSDGVSFGQHGCTHRTRYASPRRRSEFSGLSHSALAELLDRGLENLSAMGIRPRVLVPPFNRFDAGQWPVLAARYDVITGGPESIARMGFHGGPQWRDGAVYLPCYAPLYARAAVVEPAVERLIDAHIGTWIPLVLHSGWETADGFAALRRLARRIASFAVSWDELLADMDLSRQSVAESR